MIERRDQRDTAGKSGGSPLRSRHDNPLESIQQRLQWRQFHRLDEMQVNTCILRLATSLGIAVAGNSDQKWGLTVWQQLLPKPLGNLDSVHSGHGEVEEYDVRAVRLGHLECFHPITGNDSLKPPAAEQHGHAVGSIRIVFHDKDAQGTYALLKFRPVWEVNRLVKASARYHSSHTFRFRWNERQNPWLHRPPGLNPPPHISLSLQTVLIHSSNMAVQSL
jgi:hypothetical protein